MCTLASVSTKVLCFGLLAASFANQQAVAEDDAAQLSDLSRTLSARAGTAPSVIETQTIQAHRAKRANFEREGASQETRRVADWVVNSGDNRGMPFVIVDKVDAKVFVFYPDGRLRSATRALLGLARGDDVVPGIGDRELSSIRPEERTTPAGRFMAALGSDLRGEDVLWVDYDSGVAMHRVITTKPEERRLQRLATSTSFDKRITYGCINVPAKFYNNVVHPTFTGTSGIVYVLPETKLVSEVFASYDAEARAGDLSR
jgi:hypothetical protein